MKRDAAGAIAVVFYLLAQERETSAELISIEDVVGTLGNGETERRKSIGARLHEIGHDPDDATDPVMARWRAACLDCTPRGDSSLISDFAREQATMGTVLANALAKALQPWGYQTSKHR